MHSTVAYGTFTKPAGEQLLTLFTTLLQVSKLKSLRVVLVATLNVMPETANVVILFIFLSVLFATVALSLFMEEFSHCTYQGAADRNGCLGIYTSHDNMYPVPVVWELPKRNFKNVFSGLSTLLEVSSAENWIPVMWSAMDVTKKDTQPRQNAEASNALLFVTYLILVRLVILRL